MAQKHRYLGFECWFRGCVLSLYGIIILFTKDSHVATAFHLHTSLLSNSPSLMKGPSKSSHSCLKRLSPNLPFTKIKLTPITVSTTLLSESNQFQNADSIDSDEEVFTFPIFPLRKNMKFPTERITLTLYEDRYIALSDYILSTKENISEKIFGAFYCSEKPQMVREGIYPITPVMDVGDVGTAFAVTHYSENPRIKDDGTEQRRVQWRAVGMGRFRVTEILQNGYGGGSKVKEGEPPLPFILVRAIHITDDVLFSDKNNDVKQLLQLESDIFSKIVQNDGKVARLLLNLQDCESSYMPSFPSSSDAMSRPFWLSSSIPFSSSDLQQSFQPPDDYSLVEQAFLKWNTPAASKYYDIDEYIQLKRIELFSFAMASTLVPERNSGELMTLLTMTSTLERLQYIKNTQPWERLKWIESFLK